MRAYFLRKAGTVHRKNESQVVYLLCSQWLRPKGGALAVAEARDVDFTALKQYAEDTKQNEDQLYVTKL